MAAVIVGGLVRTHPAVVLDTHVGASTEAVGILLVLRAFASGCSALTGVEAIANAVPEFRKPGPTARSTPRSGSASCSAGC